MASRRNRIAEGGILAALSDTPPPGMLRIKKEERKEDDSSVSTMTTPRRDESSSDAVSSPLRSSDEEESSEEEEESSSDEESHDDSDDDSETEASFQGDTSLKGDDIDDMLASEQEEETVDEDHDDHDDDDVESEYDPEDAEDDDSDLEADDCDEDEIRPARKNKARSPEKQQHQSKTNDEATVSDSPADDEDASANEEFENEKTVDEDSELEADDCDEDEIRPARMNKAKSPEKTSEVDAAAFSEAHLKKEMHNVSPFKVECFNEDGSDIELEEKSFEKHCCDGNEENFANDDFGYTGVGFDDDDDDHLANAGAVFGTKQEGVGCEDTYNLANGNTAAELDAGADPFDSGGDNNCFVEDNETITVVSSRDDSRVVNASHNIDDEDDAVVEVVVCDEDDDDDEYDEVVAEILEDDVDQRSDDKNCSYSEQASVDILYVDNAKQSEADWKPSVDFGENNYHGIVTEFGTSVSASPTATLNGASTKPCSKLAPELPANAPSDEQITKLNFEGFPGAATAVLDNNAAATGRAKHDSPIKECLSIISDRLDMSDQSDNGSAMQDVTIDSVAISCSPAPLKATSTVCDDNGLEEGSSSMSESNEQQDTTLDVSGSNKSQNANDSASKLPIQDEKECYTNRVKSEICEPLSRLSLGEAVLAIKEDVKERNSITMSNADEPKEATNVQTKECSASGNTIEKKLESKIVDSPKRDDNKENDDSKRRTMRQPLRREGSVKRGKWKLGSKIGSGSFGVVHIGLNTHTGTLMAVKSVKMEPAAMKDAKREIQLMKALKHTNIVQYYGAEMDAKYLHIFQEWVPAGSVTAMLSKFGPFPLEVLRNYLAQILEGLAYLHENSVMHRDIKGSNILVNDEGIVKLADFGASKRLAQLQNDMMLSLTMRGTPYFMAPEVFEEKYSSKADVWSVGCVAYQMATGMPPWKDLGLSNPVSLFQHISNNVGPPIIDGVATGSLFEKFKKLVARCFERAPEKRPSARDMLDDLLFSAEHVSVDDDQSEGRDLFSPVSMCSQEYLSSPIAANLSPIRPQARRRNSIGTSPFMSPPLPRSSRKRCSPSLFSPRPDSSEWPTWARKQMNSSDTSEPCLLDNSLENQVIETKNMMDSLAFSTDSQGSQRERELNSLFSPPDSIEFGKSPRHSGTKSPLLGLQLIHSICTNTDQGSGAS